LESARFDQEIVFSGPSKDDQAMGRSKVQLITRKVLAALLVAFFLIAEPTMWYYAVETVKSGDRYIWSEAVGLFIVLNMVCIGVPAAIIWDMVRPRE